ncbi:hypothetical protein F8388_024396 [Cannabis sativa]|uniref:Uncharacterized protein n=1 Tax=Cannabis sativa TaxID=3483 RepID=A0A7J6DSQ5_CANSA|nr:hypothetical protein G4B88_031219 [Cannabis sativa]KAF4349128.1 hypothetical protein F8388_024396 [Cannabis sativa]
MNRVHFIFSVSVSDTFLNIVHTNTLRSDNQVLNTQKTNIRTKRKEESLLNVFEFFSPKEKKKSFKLVF